MTKTMRKILAVLLSVCMVCSVFVIGTVPAYADLVNNPGAVNNTGYVQVDVCTTVYLDSGTVDIDLATSGYSVGSGYPVSFKSEATIILNCSYGDYYYGSEIAYGSANGTTYNLSGYYYWGSNYSTVTAWETSPTAVNGPTGYCIMAATNTAYLPVPALNTSVTYPFNTVATANYVLVNESTEAPVSVTLHTYCSHTNATVTQYDGSNHWKHCNVCGANWDTAGHSWSEYSRTPATCNAPGTVYYSCGCGATTTSSLAQLTHSFTTYSYNNNATCTSDGTETAYCDHGCGASDTRTKVGTHARSL